jgi:hypothetical protein
MAKMIFNDKEKEIKHSLGKQRRFPCSVVKKSSETYQERFHDNYSIIKSWDSNVTSGSHFDTQTGLASDSPFYSESFANALMQRFARRCLKVKC